MFKGQTATPQYPDSLAQPPQEEFKQSAFFHSGGESLLSKVSNYYFHLFKMGGMIIAKAFLPTGNHLKQGLAYLDLAIKVELVLVRIHIVMMGIEWVGKYSVLVQFVGNWLVCIKFAAVFHRSYWNGLHMVPPTPLSSSNNWFIASITPAQISSDGSEYEHPTLGKDAFWGNYEVCCACCEGFAKCLYQYNQEMAHLLFRVNCVVPLPGPHPILPLGQRLRSYPISLRGPVWVDPSLDLPFHRLVLRSLGRFPLLQIPFLYLNRFHFQYVRYDGSPTLTTRTVYW